MKQFMHIGKWLAVVGFCLLLTACSKVTQKKYNEVQNNMSMREVVSILGEPTLSENINIAGMSGTSAIWKDKNAEIDIQFLNDKVTVKSFSKYTEQQKQENEA